MDTPRLDGAETPAPPGGYRNVHGRRAGRGARPYLIVLKLLGVATFTGGLMAVLIAVLLAPVPGDLAGWQAQSALIARLYVRVIVPGLVAALVCGALLAASIWRVMVAMRWFVVKMLLIAVAVPGLHFYMRGRSIALQILLAQPRPDFERAAALRGQLLLGTCVALAFAVTAIILGRVKPRLGQDYGWTFGRQRQPPTHD